MTRVGGANDPDDADAPRSTAWEVAALVIFAAAIASRVHAAFAVLPMMDFDGAGHLLNIAELYRGHLPDLESWLGFHPPLYHALVAMLWRLLPPGVSLHVGARLVSLAAGVGVSAITWIALRRVVTQADAAIAATAAFCVPAMAFSSSSVGNETTCALFTAAALARFVGSDAARLASYRHALVTGLLAGAAALAKATGLVAIAFVAWGYAIGVRGRPRRAAACAACAFAVGLAMTAPHDARLIARTGRLTAIVSGAGSSGDLREFMEKQPPGVRRWIDYATVPATTFTEPVHWARGLHESVPGLLYATTWADAHTMFIPASAAAMRARSALATLGLVPSLLGAFGLVTVLRRPALRAAFGVPVACAAAILASLLVYTWIVPFYSAVKASYLLPGWLGVGALLAAGLEEIPAAWRSFARAAVLGVAAIDTIVTSAVWW
jgi:Dolichyl-phosphate-mannose-protein mannosyltransferase